MIITGLIELKDIKGEYDIVDIKENVEATYISQDTGDIISEEEAKTLPKEKYSILKNKVVTILLRSNVSYKNNILIERVYDYTDEFTLEESIPRVANDIVLNVVNVVMKWDLVSKNIGKGLIKISAVPFTSADISLYENIFIQNIAEFEKYLENLSLQYHDNSEQFKYKKINNTTCTILS